MVDHTDVLQLDCGAVKRGDRLRVNAECEVVGLTSTYVLVRFDGCGVNNGLEFAALAKAEILPQPLKVGDWVEMTHDPIVCGELVAIHGDWAWLGDHHDSGLLRKLDSLRRAERPAKPDPTARGSGRTSAQMKAAPHGAWFVWCNDHLAYPKDLAKHLGRSDLRIVGAYHSLATRGWKHVVYDHAYTPTGNAHQKSTWGLP